MGAKLNRYILVVGGSYQTKESSIYDPEAKCWHKAKETNKRKYAHGLVCLDNRVYAIGGGETEGEVSVECFDPEANVWTSVARMIHRHGFFGSCALNGRIYAVGGQGNFKW